MCRITPMSSAAYKGLILKIPSSPASGDNASLLPKQFPVLLTFCAVFNYKNHRENVPALM